VDDEAGVALDLRGVGMVVVDAMAVECDRGIAEEKQRIGVDLPAQVSPVGAGVAGAAVPAPR
jgi:hypothetical protein